MMLVDTHAHLYCEEFDADRDEAVARALSAGVGHIFLPAIDKETYRRQEQLAASNPAIFHEMMGLHPTSVTELVEDDLKIAEERLFSRPDGYVGVGEIGLDFYWDTTYAEQQAYALERQIGWAEELGKPVALHIRNAYDEAFELLHRHGSARYRGIMHCFSGTLQQAFQAMEMGFMLGIGGTLTYKKSSLPEIVQAVPLGSLVLETDAPYLAPVPHRGKRNESSFIACTASALAGIKGIAVEEVAEITTANALRLFGME